jgi:hypothetical protein
MSVSDRTRSVAWMALRVALLFGIESAPPAMSQTTAHPYIVEWVYKAKWGYQDEFWQIFKKYQIATLNREKELGGVLRYEIFRPALHTSEDHRWDLRVVIYYKDAEAPAQARAIEKELFPDEAKLQREERRRWELTEVHWDLPIRQVDPSGIER